MIKIKVISRKLRTQDKIQDTTNFGGKRSLTCYFVVMQFFTINLSPHLQFWSKLKILSFLWSTWHITSMSNCEECVGYMESHSIFYWGPKVLELKRCVKIVITRFRNWKRSLHKLTLKKPTQMGFLCSHEIEEKLVLIS